MASATDVCNLALTRARVGTIGDINESSAEAVKCKILYPLARDHILEKYPWRFAKSVKAAADTGITPNEWAYQYDYPNDCLRLLYLVPESTGLASMKGLPGMFAFSPINYEVAVAADESTKVINTDYQDPYIAYTKRITNTDLWSETFVQTLAWYLAADLAIAFGGDSAGDIRKLAMDEYRRGLAEASALDANQAQSATKTMPANLAARSSTMPSHYYMNGQFYRRY